MSELNDQAAPPVLDEELSDKTLGKLLGEIVGVAIVKQLKEGRWFTNWRTLDERDKRTVDDFQQIKWPEDIGLIGGMCVDIVSAIKPKVTTLIEERAERLLNDRTRPVAGEAKTTMLDVVFGTPEGQAAVQRTMERSAEVIAH